MKVADIKNVAGIGGGVIGDGEVHLVAHAGDHRNARRGDSPRHRFLVECPEILNGAAAAPYQ